jgi:cation transport ATPase
MTTPSLHRPSRRKSTASLRLERWQRRMVYVAVMLLTLSGASWLLGHYFLRPQTEFGAAISPLEPWSMKLHGAAAICLFFLLGTLLNTHIRRALRSQRNRFTGWMMLVLASVLTLTGYGLYYLVGEDSRNLWSTAHWLLGGAFALGLVLHILVGRRTSVTG